MEKDTQRIQNRIQNRRHNTGELGVLVISSDCCNYKLPQTGQLTQQTFISRSSGDWEVQVW